MRRFLKNCYYNDKTIIKHEKTELDHTSNFWCCVRLILVHASNIQNVSWVAKLSSLQIQIDLVRYACDLRQKDKHSDLAPETKPNLSSSIHKFVKKITESVGIRPLCLYSSPKTFKNI